MPGKVATARGFTLIEIMVVMVIIALIATATVMSTGSNFSQKVGNEARRLAAIIRLAQDEALINSTEVGVILDETKYTFVLYEQGQWLPITNEKMYEEHTLLEGVEMVLQVDGFDGIVLGEERDDDDEEEDEKRSLTPQIYILSSGELSPFILTMGVESEIPEEEFFYQIQGHFDGRILLDGPYTGNLRLDIGQEPVDES